MRFLHTSDWHLGRGLHGTSLHDAQAAAMAQIVEIAREEQVDAVLVAGDVYDRSYPPVESVELLNDTLSQLTKVAPVVVIPGNHDSATRLGFGSQLFRDTLHMCPRVEDLDIPVLLQDEHGEVAVYAFPYLDPDDARTRLASDEPLERSHEAVTRAAMERVRADLERRGSPRSVIVAHAFVVGSSGRDQAEVSDSERDITVGTVDCVGADAFAGVDYVALGHLHGRQNPKSPGPVVHYSGSPLRYSFSETNHVKSVSIVDLDAEGAVTLRHRELTQPREMAQLQGLMQDLVDPEGSHVQHQDKWVQIVVTDPARPTDMVARLRAAFPHCLGIRHEPPGRDVATRKGVNTSAMSPTEVLVEFITDMGGLPPTDDELQTLEPLLAEVFAGE